MIARTIIKKLFESIGSSAEKSFKLTFADNSTYQNKEEEPVVHVYFRTPRAERKTALLQDLGFAESYFDQEIDIEGDILYFLGLSYLLRSVHRQKKLLGFLNRNPIQTLLNHWHELTHSNHSIVQAKKNALYHYNRGTEMFRKYLDPSMTYTCAYWKGGVQNLAQAQEAKNAHTLKKLCLEKNMSLIDIGGGWGPLLLMAAEQYGVRGVNVSPTPDQNRALQKEIEKRGLNHMVEIQECDFREAEGTYDRYVSLGVYEHAGKGQLEDWIRKMSEQTKDGGIGLLHFIGTIDGGIDRTGIFIRKHIFPGGYLPGLAETIQLMAKYDLEVLDIENLRRHYYHTLKAWAENFDTNWTEIHKLDPDTYNERFRRIWRFYLHGCANVFMNSLSSVQDNQVGLFQIVFSKGKTTTYPMSREFLYREEGQKI